MSSEHVLELTDQNFDDEILKADGLALVDFWADWCMPCTMLAPTIEDLAKDYAGRVKVGSVNTDDAQNTARKFGISAIPTVILFNKGEVAKKFVGVQRKKDYAAAIDELLGG